VWVKLIDHGSRMPYNFYSIKFLPSLTVEATEAGKTLFRAPLTPRGGGGYGVATQLQTLPTSRSSSMPNFIKIGSVVWISIADIHAHTHWLLYIRYTIWQQNYSAMEIAKEFCMWIHTPKSLSTFFNSWRIACFKGQPLRMGWTWCQCYKTFFLCCWWQRLISWRVFPSKPFPVRS
jgi:hypothetical protein